MMINDEMKGGLGYDPFDLHSFPYQANDPPFDATSLVLEDIERASCLDPLEVIAEFASLYDDDGPGEYRTLDMALRLFVKLASDRGRAFADIPYPDLFAAALDQAMIWERG